MRRNSFLAGTTLVALFIFTISSLSCKSNQINTVTLKTETTVSNNETSKTNTGNVSELDKTTVSRENATTATKTKEDIKTENSLPQGEIGFKTEDGININGNIFGNFKKLAVLSHMFPSDQKSWFGFAEFLNENKIAALTYDFRGYGKSQGNKDIANIYKDLGAALKFLNQYDLSEIYLIGASMGGTASIIIAAKQDINISKLITISAPDEFQNLSAKDAIKNIRCPKLFIASKSDDYAFQSMNFFYDNSSEPKEKLVLSGKSHGTFIFDEEPENGEKIKETVISFLINH